MVQCSEHPIDNNKWCESAIKSSDLFDDASSTSCKASVKPVMDDGYE